MAKKKRFTAEKKVEILREFLENRVSVSDLAEKYGVHPNSIHQWKKQLFEGAAATLDPKSERLKERQAANVLKYNQRKVPFINRHYRQILMIKKLHTLTDISLSPNQG